MIFFTAVFTLITILGLAGLFFQEKLEEKFPKIDVLLLFSTIIFVLLWIVAGFREGVGTDYYPYKDYFFKTEVYTLFNNPFEWGYYLLNKIINILTGNSRFIFLIVSFFILYVINKTILKHSPNYYLSILLFINLYFYFNSLNIMRQFIAIAIVFYSVQYIYQRDLKRFSISIVIASFFHLTSLFFWFMYFIVQKKYKTYVYLLGILLSFLFVFLFPYITNLLIVIMPRYEAYLTNMFTSSSSYSVILIIISTLMFAYILLRNKEWEKENIILFNLVYIGLILNIAASFNFLFYRVSIYFYIFVILLIPNLVQKVDKRYRNWISAAIISVSIAYCIYLLYSGNGEILPYRLGFF